MKRRFTDAELDEWEALVRRKDGRAPGEVFTVIGPIDAPTCRYCGGPVKPVWYSDSHTTDDCEHCSAAFQESYLRRTGRFNE